MNLYPIVLNLYPWVHFSIHAKMYLGVNSLRFRMIGYRFTMIFVAKSIPMGIMSRGGICLPVTPAHTPYGSRFFCTDIQILQYVATLGVYAPYEVHAPYEKSWIRHCTASLKSTKLKILPQHPVISPIVV